MKPISFIDLRKTTKKYSWCTSKIKFAPFNFLGHYFEGKKRFFLSKQRRKTSNCFSKTTVQTWNYRSMSLFSVTEKKYLKEYCTITCMNCLQKVTECLLINQAFHQVIHVLTNFRPSLMKFTNLLTMVSRFEVCF